MLNWSRVIILACAGLQMLALVGSLTDETDDEGTCTAARFTLLKYNYILF